MCFSCRWDSNKRMSSFYTHRKPPLPLRREWSIREACSSVWGNTINKVSFPSTSPSVSSFVSGHSVREKRRFTSFIKHIFFVCCCRLEPPHPRCLWPGGRTIFFFKANCIDWSCCLRNNVWVNSADPGGGAAGVSDCDHRGFPGVLGATVWRGDKDWTTSCQKCHHCL